MKGKHLRRRAKAAAIMVKSTVKDKVATAISLPSFREKQIETITLPRRKRFDGFNACGRQKMVSGEKPLVWG